MYRRCRVSEFVFYVAGLSVLASLVHSEDIDKCNQSNDGVANTRPWKFKVKYEPKHTEQVCITGDCDVLGSWKEKNAIPLAYNEHTGYWYATVNIPADRDVHYRYFTCTFEVVNKQAKTKINQWETGLNPRTVDREKVLNESNEECDVFGVIDGATKLENGWLTDDVAVFIRLTSMSVAWMSERASQREVLIKLSSSTRCPNEGDPKQKRQDDVIFISNSESKDGQFRELCAGEYYSFQDATDGAVTFMARTFTADNQEFTFEFKDPIKGESVYFSHLLLNHELGGCMGDMKIPIQSADHEHVGNLNANYLVVRPQPGELGLTFKSSFAKYWNNAWTCFEIGHRGSGKSFSRAATDLLNTQYRENTLSSLKSAGVYGANLVEFDVQLTSDLIPTVFHDFNVLLEVRQKTANSVGLLTMPFHKMSSENLKDFKIRHVRETNGEVIFENDGGDDSIPFPSLKQVLNSVDPHLGFNIEVKHTSQDDGQGTFDSPIDMNVYVDRILQVVFENVGLRYIVFSSFSPQICLMLRLKQNRYPVMFLTKSVKTPTPDSSEAKKILQEAINFAKSADLLGIVAEAKDLLRHPTLVKMILDNALIAFSWGEDVNNDENIEKLKTYGIQGVIFDKIDQFGQKQKYDIIFSEGVL